MQKLMLAAGLLSLWVTAAHGQWMHEANADAFSDEVMNIAVAGASNGNGVGFRCTSSDDLILLFMTTEEIDNETASTLNSVAPTVLVRVDDEPVTTFKAEMVASPEGTLIAMVEDGAIAELAQSVATATERVAVALEMLGDRYHNTEFLVRGSTKAVADLMAGCGIE